MREHEYIESKSAKSKEDMPPLKNCIDVEYSIDWEVLVISITLNV